MSVVRVPDGLRKAAKAAREAGWVIERTPGGHIRWVSPAGELVITAATSASCRGVRNHLARLRRAGLEV